MCLNWAMGCTLMQQNGNLTRFINHSHEPNCVALKRLINGFNTKWIITTKAIAVGEFLSMDYNFEVPGCKNNCCSKKRKSKN
mmetsp:Transcript_10657/g.23555  ORF Transcript_10657/g.23555 Transcript_10657/m.23555 type:complete len:82 (+) Transcript_10657:729-974(+)